MNYEDKCRNKFNELLDETGPMAGYSKSQVLSAMVILSCTIEEAQKAIDSLDDQPDWSEATWKELRTFFV